MGAPRALALCHCFGGTVDFQTGRWDDAEVALHKAIELYRQVGSASGESFSLQRLGVLFTAQGKVDEAREILSEGLVVAERAAMRAHCLTRMHASMLRNRLAANDAEGVRQSLQEGLEAARRHGHCVTCNALLLPEAVRAELAVEDIDAADKHASDLEATATEFESRAWIAMAAHARGRVLAAQDDHTAAFEALDRARQAYLAMDQEYDAARCMMAQASCLQKSDTQPEEAAALETQAREMFERLGASGGES